MSTKEILECSTIKSIAGKFLDGKLTKAKPCKTPQYSCSLAVMVVGGGVGKKVKPGEITLPHNGVLFLDALPEFPQHNIVTWRHMTRTMGSESDILTESDELFTYSHN